MGMNVRDTLPFIFGSEIRFCTLLIGTIELVWSIVGLLPEHRSLFAQTLYSRGLDVEWFGIMIGTGAVTVTGALFPWRSGRHIGLFLSALIWFVMFGIFSDADVFTPVTFSMPVFGLFSMVLMYADAKRKPREKLAE